MMRFNKKTKYSFLAFLFAVGSMGCGDASVDPVSVGPSSPKYLLNGVLSNENDANGFSYYINGDEAYVARGTNTSLTPEIPDEVTLGGNTYSVTGVYHSGFSKANISSITLPLSIETIDYQAFANSSLQSVVIPCNVEEMGCGAFMNCHSLAAVQFKNDESAGSSTIGVCGGGGGGGGGGGDQGESHLQVIPDYCFFNCENLTTVAFPRSLTTVDSCAFSACVGLTKLAFLSGFTTLKKYALESCENLTDVYLPSTFTGADGYPANCESGAFYNVKSSCTVHLSTTTDDIYNTWTSNNNKAWRYYGDGNSTLSVAARATQDVGLGSDYLYRVENGKATIFSYAPSTFPASGVVVMPNEIDGYDVAKAEATTYASYKTQVTQIYLSNNLESIESNFFVGMTNLTTVSSTGNGCYTPADNVIDLGAMTKLTTVGDNLFTDNNDKNETYMKTTFSGIVTLPISLQTIGTGAFKDLKKATKIQFASGTPSVTRIYDKAFMNFGWNRGSSNYGDSPLSFFELTLPASCENIHSQAFGNMLGLKKIVFEGASGKTLTIKPSAFAYCRSLCEIVFPRENTAIKIQEKAFYCCSSGGAKGFLNHSGIEEVFLPANVTELGSLAFASNERACFFFENTARPGTFYDNYNQVFYENVSGNQAEIQINSVKDNNYIGIRESNGEYLGVGIFDGSTSSKKRYIQTDDFCFVETGVGTKEFICARYRYKPENLGNNVRTTATVPEYIKFKASATNAYDGENSTLDTDFKVVSIGDSCFSACYSRGGKALGEVKVPNAIRRIGDNAFLRSIFFNKLTAYTGNSVSADYTFPSGLKYIGRSAFACTRLVKALKIPGDVKTFDMISLAALNAQVMPISLTDVDKTSPRLYRTDQNQPARYSCIFANDWMLNEVTFTTVANPTMTYDSTIHALYRLKEVAQNGTVSDRVQLLMIGGNLTSGFTVYSANNEKDYVSEVDINIGGTGHELQPKPKSVRYGAWRMANWATGLTLDSSIEELFATNYGSTVRIPQALLTACVNLPNYLNIGAAGNDATYTVKTKSFGFTASENEIALPPGVLRNAGNVTSMTIPANLSEISNNAFDRASGITNWTTPDENGELTLGGEEGGVGVLDLRHNTSLTRIGTSAFWGSSNISKIYFPPKITDLGERSAFEKKDTAGSSESSALVYVNMEEATLLTTLQTRTFQAHKNLATVILPPNITSIGEAAFSGCNVTDITWPTTASFTTIGKNAFSQSRVVNLEIPNTVTTIGDTAFASNTAMVSVKLSDALSSLSSSAFNSNTALDRIYFASMRPAGRDKGAVTLSDSSFPANVKYAMLPQWINDGGGKRPFNSCSGLKAIFYGAKASQASGSTTITSYSNSAKTAALYYFAETAADITNESLKYWRQKPDNPHIAQVVTKSGDTLVPGDEYNFETGVGGGIFASA